MTVSPKSVRKLILMKTGGKEEKEVHIIVWELIGYDSLTKIK